MTVNVFVQINRNVFSHSIGGQRFKIKVNMLGSSQRIRGRTHCRLFCPSFWQPWAAPGVPQPLLYLAFLPVSPNTSFFLLQGYQPLPSGPTLNPGYSHIWSLSSILLEEICLQIRSHSQVARVRIWMCHFGRGHYYIGHMCHSNSHSVKTIKSIAMVVSHCGKAKHWVSIVMGSGS